MPEVPRAHVHLAHLHFKNNLPAEALAELDAYLAALPNAPDKDKVLALANQIRTSARK